MTIKNKTGDLHRQVGRYIYDHLIETTQAPTMAQVAETLLCSIVEVQAAYQRLTEERAIVLQGSNGEVLMAPPFSAVPTTFSVQSGSHHWWANCIWDALGIQEMTKRDARIATSCACCGDLLTITIKGGAMAERNGLPHFALPLKEWWKNVFFA